MLCPSRGDPSSLLRSEAPLSKNCVTSFRISCSFARVASVIHDSSIFIALLDASVALSTSSNRARSSGLIHCFKLRFFRIPSCRSGPAASRSVRANRSHTETNHRCRFRAFSGSDGVIGPPSPSSRIRVPQRSSNNPAQWVWPRAGFLRSACVHTSHPDLR